MRILLAFLIILAFGVFGFLSYMGMFAPYEVKESDIGPYKVVYKSHVGPYTETGKIGMEVYESLKVDDIETYKGLGIYYDTPSSTPKEKLRSDMGSIIEKGDYEKLSALGDKYTTNSYGTKDVPVMKSVVVEFPIKNIFSYMFGPMKVYPLITKYMNEMGYKPESVDAGYEIYDMTSNTILYAVPIVE